MTVTTQANPAVKHKLCTRIKQSWSDKANIRVCSKCRYKLCDTGPGQKCIRIAQTDELGFGCVYSNINGFCITNRLFKINNFNPTNKVSGKRRFVMR